MKLHTIATIAFFLSFVLFYFINRLYSPKRHPNSKEELIQNKIIFFRTILYQVLLIIATLASGYEVYYVASYSLSASAMFVVVPFLCLFIFLIGIKPTAIAFSKWHALKVEIEVENKQKLSEMLRSQSQKKVDP